MKKFKLWHLALIALAVFLVFGGIVSIISYRNYSWNNTNWSIGIGDEYTIDESKSIDIDGKTKISI